MTQVEVAVAADPGPHGSWSSELVRRLDELRLAFADHVELTEAPAGFFDEIVSDAPRLANAVDKLRDEHQRISESLDRASEDTHAAAAGGEGEVLAARAAVGDVLELLERHRDRGATVVYEAYNVDIEAGD
jgi:hypothetical protein